MLVQDREKLEHAQQSVDLAQSAVKDLYSAEDHILGEHAYEMMEILGKMNMRLRRLLDVS